MYFNEYKPLLKPGQLSQTLQFQLFIHGTNQRTLYTELAPHHRGTKSFRDRSEIRCLCTKKTYSTATNKFLTTFNDNGLVNVTVLFCRCVILLKMVF